MLIRTILFACVLASGAGAADRPNIVFILLDDFGWADAGFHAGRAPTPHIDRLAQEGLELTQHYVAPVCAPTRTALLTGRSWSRFGIFGNGGNDRILPWDTVTLPRALKTLGYETALTGKWHLGSKPEWGPNQFGFDHSYGSLAGGVGPFDHFYKTGDYMRTWHRNGTLLAEKGHVTDLIANEAVAWLGRRSGAPFFLYVPFTAVHLPVKEPAAWLERVPAEITGELPRHYAACIMHVDDAIGRIVAALEKTGARSNTLVVVSSDNGGTTAENNDPQYPSDNYPAGPIPSSNAPLRGHKAGLHEGGIRVVTVVNWAGKLAPGKVNQPVHISDWMPTFCALAGYKPERELKWDGQNIWPVLKGTAQPVTRVFYTPYQRGAAVRAGDWKLIVEQRSGPDFGRVELYNLAADPNETMNRSAEMPEKVRSLQQALRQAAMADGDAAVVEGKAARKRR